MLDPSVIAQLQPAKFENPLSIFSTVTNLRTAQIQQQQERFKLQQAMNLEQEQEAVKAALQNYTTETGKPLDLAGMETVAFKMRGLAPTVSQQMLDKVYEARTKYATAQKTEADTAKSRLDMTISMAQSIDPTDPVSWARAVKAIDVYAPGQNGEPGMGTRFLGDTPDPARLKKVIEMGETSATRVQARGQAMQYALEVMKQDYEDLKYQREQSGPAAMSAAQKAIGTHAQSVNTPEDYQEMLQMYGQGSPSLRGVVSTLPTDDWKKGKAMALGFLQTPELQETGRHNRVTESQGQQNITLRTREVEAREEEVDQKKENVKDIANAIEKGDQPPDLTRLYGMAGPLKAELARRGFDLTKASEDWQATSRHIATMNGPQQQRLRQAVEFTQESLPIIRELAGQWKSGGYGPISRKALELAAAGAAGTEKQSIATRLMGQIADLTSELGTVYKGGNSSTDDSLALAAQNLKAEWAEKTLYDNLDQVDLNLQIRKNTIKNAAAWSAEGSNRYTKPWSPDTPKDTTAPAPQTGKLKPNAEQSVWQNGVEYLVKTDANGKIISAVPK